MEKRRKRLSQRARRRHRNRRIAAVVAAAAAGLLVWFGMNGVRRERAADFPPVQGELLEADPQEGRPPIDVQLLTPNPYSRPQEAMGTIRGIVIHYTANPGSTAQENHDYFEGLKDSGAAYASSHFVIGMEGEIIQCIPSSEISYASNDRNGDTISIECCHPDATGEFSEETYDALVRLVKWLEETYNLGPQNVIRHYDVTGKNCPKYFVENEEAWTAFKENVSLAITSEN